MAGHNGEGPSKIKNGKEQQGKGIKPVERTESEDSYNPFEHRNVPKPNSDFGSLAHILKTSLGSGILAMPMAFKNAGLVLGTVGTVVIGIICTHCVELLVRSSQILCKKYRRPTLTYAETVEFSFECGPKKCRQLSKPMRYIVLYELIGSFVLGNTVYVIIITKSLCQFVEFMWHVNLDIRYFILMIWLPLVLMCMLRNLKSLVPFSVVAIIFVLFSFAIILYYIFRDINPTESVNLVSPILQWPVFLSTVVFAIEGIGTVLSIENEMKNPQHFIGIRCNVLYTSMSIVILIYTIIGFFGYLQYGAETHGSITLNLPVKDGLAQAVKVLIALAIFFTYALQFYVPINLIWDMMKNYITEKYQLSVNILLRFCLVTFTILVAVILPNLEEVISLVGAVCFSTLGLLVPAIIDVLLRWPNFGRIKWRLWKNILIMILALVTLVGGVSTSLINLIKVCISINFLNEARSKL